MCSTKGRNIEAVSRIHARHSTLENSLVVMPDLCKETSHIERLIWQTPPLSKCTGLGSCILPLIIDKVKF